MDDLNVGGWFSSGAQGSCEGFDGFNKESVVGCCGSIVVTVYRPRRITIEELDRILFPYDPIREYFDQEIEKIEQKYRWIKRMEDW